MFNKIESALGFKLFVWQKAYIAIGTYRKSGLTTAKILKSLLEIDSPPLDLSCRPKNPREGCYRYDLKEIQSKLRDAGIPTRIVFWNKKEKDRFTKNAININKHLEEEAREIHKKLWRY